MESSSPLAALQPQAITPSWGMVSMGRPSRAGRSSALFGSRLGGCGRADRGRFAFEPLMESSPTTSLVADLSQNFHIDRTPQIATPRRSLFTSFSFAGGINNSPLSSMPIPSSPLPAESDIEAMDMSPLPHKPAFVPALIESPLISPTTENPDTSMMCTSPVSTEEPVAAPVTIEEAPKRATLHERKKSGSFSRAPLHRHRSSISFKHAAPAASSLSFSSRASTVPPLDLDQMFGPSPQPTEKKKERRLAPAFIPIATPLSRSKSFTPSSMSEDSLNGSPVAPLNRRGCARPKMKIRRTLSMFEHPEEAVSPQKKQEEKLKARYPSSPATKAPGETATLPSFKSDSDNIRRIGRDVLLDVMDGKYKEKYDDVIVVDCRFEYEYDGGHIAGAVNLNTTDSLDKEFFNENKVRTGNTLMIFHCEYSAHRAPRMALHLRSTDRQVNMHRYPALSYPEIYVLDGGYKEFFNEYRERCEPQQYIKMEHDDHKQACERGMATFRRTTKFGRAQSYTFGAQRGIDASPSSGFTKRSLGGCSRDGVASNPYKGRPRFEQRRMASY